MSLLFHSPTHAPLLPAVTHTREEHLGVAVDVHSSRSPQVGCRGCEGEGKTASRGIFSPRVRVNFAIRLRRISSADGTGGTSENVGDIGVPAIGESGTRVSVGERGTALMRSTSGRGASGERRDLMEAFGAGTTSMVVRDSVDVSDTREELDDEVEYIDAFSE